jgi:hypothetical protein
MFGNAGCGPCSRHPERIRSYIAHSEPDRLQHPGLDEFIRQTHGIKTEIYTTMISSDKAVLRPGIAAVIRAAIEDSRNGLLSSVAAGIPTIVTPSKSL